MRKYRIIMILCVMSLFLVACTNKNDKTKVKMEETQENGNCGCLRTGSGTDQIHL
mgnify:CR=1 FL=1